MVLDRQAVRAILLNPGNETLLQRVNLPTWRQPIWLTPGGGLEEGENIQEGLRRELREEVGLYAFEIGPLVWKREHTYDWFGERVRQREDYFIVHTPHFEPVLQDEEEAKLVDCCRWWTVDDLAVSPDRFTPLALASIIRRYIVSGAPDSVLDVEVAID